MLIRSEKKRLAAKKGWYDGRKGKEPDYPVRCVTRLVKGNNYELVEKIADDLVEAYLYGYGIGLESLEHKNPFV